MLLLMHLTFDPDSYSVLSVANLIGSSADVSTRIIKRCFWDLNQLVVVLYFHGWPHRKVLTVLGPCDMRSWP